MKNYLKIIGVIFGYLVSVYFLLLFFENFDTKGILDQAKLSINFFNYLLGMVIFLVSLYFRALRWEALVYGNIIPSSKKSFKNYLTYIVSDGLNNLLPFRTGDFYRITFTKNESHQSIGKLLILLIFERLFDLIILLLFGVFALFSIKNNAIFQEFFLNIFNWFLTKQYIFLLAITSTLIITYFVIKLSQLDTKIHEFVIRFRKLSIPLFKVIFFTLSTWLFEFFVFIIIFNTLLIDIEVLEMFIVFISSTLSTLIPSAPGYIGTFHFISSEILGLFYVSGSLASFYSVIIHLVLVLPTILISVFYLNVRLITIVRKSLNNKNI